MGFVSRYKQKEFEFFIKEDNQDFSMENIIKRIHKAEWRDLPYKAQNWGNWFHRMGAYVGKIKPAIAHLIIKVISKKKDIILDPFCGIGTVPLEADLLGRIAIGVDLNPYAYHIARSKFDRKPKEGIMKYLDKIRINTKKIDLKKCSNDMKIFYDPKTLKEILFLLEKFKKDKQYFLIGCLLGIIHGHRPGHLSAITSLVIPFIPRTKPIYKEVIPRIKAKVNRMYFDDFPINTKGKIYKADARKLPLKDNEVDVIFSSPPYYNTLNYVTDNRLRNEFLGFDRNKREKLKKKLIQNKNNYLLEMKKVGFELKRVLKRNGLCVFILGDHHEGKKIINTAVEIAKIYKQIGFQIHDIFEDAMPVNKALPTKFKRLKKDRIMIMTNKKFRKIE